MLKLDDLEPTKAENDTLFDTIHPWHEHVAIGYLRAQRNHHGGKRFDGISTLFGGFFNQEDSR